LAKKGKKDKDTPVVEEILQKADDVVAETSPVVAEVDLVVVGQSGGSSPWDPLFNREAFLERMVDVVGTH
jgi:hypothetical protein